MTIEPFEPLDQVLRDVEAQSARLSGMIAQIRLYHLTDASRRNVTEPVRRHGERRSPDRAMEGRRTLSDRRLPPQVRLIEWQIELAEVLERSIKLYRLKQNLQA
jgi:hypothetical protein